MFEHLAAKLTQTRYITPTIPDAGTPNLPGASDGTTIGTPIVSIINWGIGIAGGVAVLVLIISGFYYVTAAGDENRLERGKDGIKGAIIGIIIMLLAAIIVNTINIALTRGTTSGRTFNQDSSSTGPRPYSSPNR